jgi:hypothetical protein
LKAARQKAAFFNLGIDAHLSLPPNTTLAQFVAYRSLPESLFHKSYNQSGAGF